MLTGPGVTGANGWCSKRFPKRSVPVNFASDNAYGAMPEMVAALAIANDGPARSYGDDEITARVRTRLRSIFEHEVFVYPVVTGTAANALSLATLVPPHGAIICHADSHIAVEDRKSTRLNSSHPSISYAVFCLKKKKKKKKYE